MNWNRVLSILVVAVCIVAVGRAEAQTYTVLHSFPNGTNGVSPQGLVVSGDTICAMAYSGGSGGGGTVFKVNTDGNAFEVLHNFTGGTNDGAGPRAGLILSGNTLYGTTVGGGSSAGGTVFSISSDGTSYTNLHSFSGTDGAGPQAPLVLSSNRLYGTTYGGGSTGNGTVFALNSDGSGFTNLYSFTQQAEFTGTNTDGRLPIAGLAVSGNRLYGTTIQGGYSAWGTVFSLNTDGTGFTNLHNFTGGNDGGNPYGGVSLSSNILYGTTPFGGTFNSGTLFALNTDGTTYRILHSFDQIGQLLVPPYYNANYGGAFPIAVQPSFPAALVKSGNKLYGAALGGGGWGIGTVFELNIDGTGFNVLYTFAFTFPISPVGPWTTNLDGGSPSAVVLSGNSLYGTASAYGVSGNGTVFSITLPLPQLAISHSNENLVLSWPTDFDGYTLQSTSSLGSSGVWTTNLPAPVVVNGQYTVTNAISGSQEFFRLVK